MNEELRLIQDGDGHWYLIPWLEEDRFNAWVSATEADEEIYFNYDDHRVDGPHAVKILAFEIIK